jgi:hypothetical protein
LKNLEDLAILVALLLTDGCVSASRLLIFHNKSEAMHELFRQQVVKLFGSVHFTERIESNGTKRTQVASKLIVKKLLEACKLETFRRKQFENGEFPAVKLPEFIKSLSRSTVNKFLQVVFSADGSVSLGVRWHKKNKSWEIRRRVELTCKHPELRNDFFELLKFSGFSPRISGSNITLEKKNDILKFAQEIRFIEGVRIGGDSKNWKGFEKNQILDFAVRTLNFTKKDLENFNTKEKVIDFFKLLL